jgi:G:T-mismatch repair DNA endonuclease (very short patch repair protein)
MLIGIVRTKINDTLKDNPKIVNTIISGNKTYTVKCGNYLARSYDKIIFKCDNCGIETSIGKRIFFNRDIQLCSKCLTEKTSIEKYKVNSPNKSEKVKRKQHKNSKRKYVDGNNYRLRKTKNKEELSKLRSKNAKKLWEKGVYKNVDYSSIVKKRWENPEYRNKNIKSNRSKISRNKKSVAAKKHWENQEYRNKMSKIGIRISKFQLNVFNNLNDEWLMEYPIENTTFTVDMYNPNTNEVIECYGDYWHCNPKKYKEYYYNKRVKKTAKEIWASDEERINAIEKLGYKVKIIWENL